MTAGNGFDMDLSTFEEELAELNNKNLFRRLRTLEPGTGVTAFFRGKEILLFCGNDYLGLSRHPRVIQAAQNALKYHGTGSGAARLISGTSDQHTRLEEKLAAFKNKDQAVVFSAGYLANLGVLTALAGEKDLIVMDKLCHASLIDGARLSGAEVRVFPHKNYARCEEIIKVEGGRSKVEVGSKDFPSTLDPRPSASKILLVTDTVFSMDGDLADLTELARIKEKYGCLLIADDAHGTGVLGLFGRGLAEDQRLEGQIDIVTGTLSKALGTLGGFAAGSSLMIDYLINKARPFIFATSLPPVLCAAALEAIWVIESESEIRRKLWRNVQILHEGLQKQGWPMGPITSPILPLLIGDEKKALQLSEALLEQGILIPAIRTPTVPKGKARLRITVSAAHDETHIQKLLKILAKHVPSVQGTGITNPDMP